MRIKQANLLNDNNNKNNNNSNFKITTQQIQDRLQNECLSSCEVHLALTKACWRRILLLLLLLYLK